MDSPLFRVLWWGLFTVIIDAYAIWSVSVGQISKFRLIMAAIMTVGFTIMVIQYKIGGSSAKKQKSRKEED
ncbi:MAG: hypothetical protein PHS52_01070 [Desulfotomaculaceae bacterium]|nr:hypothetical protein [Desulfotomaculaceae bacterium]